MLRPMIGLLETGSSAAGKHQGQQVPDDARGRVPTASRTCPPTLFAESVNCFKSITISFKSDTRCIGKNGICDGGDNRDRIGNYLTAW